MKKELEQLKKEEIRIRGKINKIEEEEIDKVQMPRLKKMVGQCYAYRDNSYSKGNYWDLFRKIIDWTNTKERGFYFIYEEFSVDSYGKITLTIDCMLPYLNKEWWDVKIPFSGFETITEKEYLDEKRKMFSEMNTQKKMRKILNSKYN